MSRESRPQVLLVNRAVVLDQHKILLIRRAAKDSWQSGKWELPGGKLERGQDLNAALEREVMEETGLLVTPVNRLACYFSEIIGTGKYAGLTYINITGIVKLDGGKTKLSEEHDDFQWVDYETALDQDLTEPSRKALIVLENHIST